MVLEKLKMQHRYRKLCPATLNGREHYISCGAPAEPHNCRNRRIMYAPEIGRFDFQPFCESGLLPTVVWGKERGLTKRLETKPKK